DDASSAKSRRPEEDKKAKEEEERRKKKQEEERKRREAEQQQQQEEEEEEEEEEEASPPAKGGDKTDGAKTAFDKIDDDRKRRIIDSLIDRLYELAEERDAKNKPAAKTATSGASTADISSLDLKVRSLRTRLRNAENATESLAKQQKDVEMKIKLNHQEVERLRKEYAASEAEYNEAIKNGAVVPEAPKRGRGTGAGKGAGFFDVVKKAQSSLWEDKFRAFKEKQRESASNQPAWVNNLRKSDNIIGTTVMKREDPEKKKEKAAWQNQPKLHKAVIDPRAKKEAEPAGAKKPAWSGVSLKKAEKK
ncbi:Hypothetical predicted protein, partial [Paramuricea clavata]